MSTESTVREEEAGRRQPGSQELSELTASWPGSAVGASPGLSFLRGWAGGLTSSRGEGVHGASGAGELLDPHSCPPPQEPWCDLCAPWNDQCPSARLVSAPGGAGGSWATWCVPPQGSESGCVAWVLFSIRWGTRSCVQFQPFYYSDGMCLLSNPWIQKPSCRQVTRLGDIRAASTGSWEASLTCEAINPT